MQAVPFEKIAAAEAMELASTLVADAPQGADIGSAALDEWLQAQTPTAAISPARTPALLTFCRLVLWHHKRIAALRDRGAFISEQSFAGGVPCSVTGEVVHFAVLLLDEAARPMSLRAHLVQEERSAAERSAAEASTTEALEAAEPQALSSAVVFVHERFGFYVDWAKHLCKVCASKVRAPVATVFFSLLLMFRGHFCHYCL
jgi:hypothetical protein